ncbi:MAG: adenine phosphoribosyltransferase [Nanoarchaeota archaeon]
MEHIKKKIRTIPHFPKEGIMFRDITTLLQDAEGLKDVVKEFKERYKDSKIDVIAGIEARGFILGGVLAHELGVGFVPLRKKGKLPFKTESITYDLEYGTDTIEIHTDAIKEGQNVLLVDDLLATGGTGLAAAQLIGKLGGKIVETAFIVDLPEVGGRKKLESAGYKVFALVEFEGE